MKFVHLHVHSHYSLLDGLPKIPELLDYVKELGMEAVALTDHGAIYGAVEFFKEAKAREIKPIIGAELYVAFEKMHQKRPNIDDKRYHIILLVKNEKGYKNLVKLITKSHLEGFYYKPRIDEDLLAECSEGLICLTSCIQGKIPQFILRKKIKEAELLAQKYKSIFGQDNFYFEIQHHPTIPEQKKVNEALIYLSKKLKIPLVATNDCHYLKPEEAEIQDILMLINTNAKPDDPERLTLRASDFSMRPPKRMIEDFKDIPEAIENTVKIAQMCNFEFEFKKIKLPEFSTPNKEPPDEYLRKLCLEGLRKRYGENPDPQVIKRMEHELEVIKKTGFATYFLIVHDFVNWAKSNKILVGPGRGSVGGSLVAYLLNITNIDPLKNNLLFERFLNPERISLPDIDVDFTDRRRNEVIEYVAKKYGRKKVAQIITFGTMAARAVVRDVGRALGYSYSFCDKIAKMIPFGYTLDQALATINELRSLYLGDEKVRKLIDYAKKLEGCVRHASTHACGVVISNVDLDEICPLQYASQSDKTIVTQFEMHSIEELGLLKMDFLGLKNLTLIEDTVSLVKKLKNIEIDIENLPPEDKKTFKLFQKGETIGVFQLESEGMRKYLKQLKPNKIDDLIAILALYRPGPLALIPEYIAGKHKKKEINYLHPKLKPILQETFGIIVYQEQVMKIAQELAGFTLGEADILRKAIGKKDMQLLKEQKNKFIEGCKKNNISETTALQIWNWIEPFGRYSFNKSHSAGYAIIAYQTAYLKAHFPTEFMCCLLTTEKADVERIGFLISECKRMGIEVLPPDINESLKNFTVIGEKQIRFGLLAIKNVGEKLVESIIEERKQRGAFTSIADFLFRLPQKELNKKSLEALIKAGAFDKLAERNQLLFNLERLLQAAREAQRTKSEGQRGLFEILNPFSKREIKLLSTKPASLSQKLRWEKELLGLYISSHPLEEFKHLLEKQPFTISKIKKAISKFINRQVKIFGIISRKKKIITKNGKPMFFLDLEDLEDKIEVVAFPAVIEKNPLLFQENKIVCIAGKLDDKDGVPKIICEEIEEIIES